MNVPSDLLYTKEHEWVRVEGQNAVVGITDHAQHTLGDVVFVELPSEGKELKAGQSFGVVESVKAVSDIYAPVSGTIIKTNADLNENPDRLNLDAYANWLIIVEMSNESELDALLDAQAYKTLIEQE